MEPTPAAPPTPPALPPVPALLNALGWAWIALGALLPISGFLALAWALLHPNPNARDQSGPLILGTVALVIALPAGLLSGVVAIVTGIGLRKARVWAAVLVLILPACAMVMVAFVLVAWAEAAPFLAFLFPGPLLLSLLGLVSWPTLLLPGPRGAFTSTARPSA